jgi:hypothetical protein
MELRSLWGVLRSYCRALQPELFRVRAMSTYTYSLLTPVEMKLGYLQVEMHVIPCGLLVADAN